MANSSYNNSPITPLLGISESFFQASPFNSSSDSSFGRDWNKQNNLNVRTFSPSNRFVKSPNFSPITKKFADLTITEEIDESNGNKTFLIDDTNSPHTPLNQTYIKDSGVRPKKNVDNGTSNRFEHDKIHRRRTMFLLPPTPTYNKVPSKLNTSDFEHAFSVDTILKEIGMTKYIDLFNMEEINIPVFLTLDDNDLMTIGIMDVEERCEILKAVETYQFLK
uniref:CSON007887 protein n=1 Tax=Culicoides sonorensis TaxID=179676 RepID=A0A336MUW0_CULSO